MSLNTLENLARDRLTAGQYEEALGTLHQVREMVVSELGPRNVRVARILDRIADALEGMADVAGALAITEDALDMRCNLFEDSHAEVFNCMDRVVTLATRFGEEARALELLGRMLKTRTVQFGADHPATLAVIFRQAGVCFELGRLAEAEEMATRVASMREKMLGSQNALTAASFVLLAQIYERQGRLAESHALLERALVVQRKLLGDTHEQVRATHALLDRVAHAAPVPVAAAVAPAAPAPLMDVLAVVAARGPDAPAARSSPPEGSADAVQAPAPDTSPRPLAEAVEVPERPPKAAEVPETSSPAPRAAVKSAGTLALALRHATMCYDAGMVEQAEMLARRVAGRVEDVARTENPVVLAASVLIGRICRSQGRLAEARERLEAALAMQRSLLGDAHEDTRATRDLLDAVLRALAPPPAPAPTLESPPEVPAVGPEPAQETPPAAAIEPATRRPRRPAPRHVPTPRRKIARKDLTEDTLERIAALLDADEAQALVELNDALAIEENAALLNARGVVWMRLKEPEEALHDFARAASLDDECDKSRFNRGLVFLELGQEDDAHRAFTEAVLLRPELVEAYVQRALIDMRRGRPDAALRDLGQSLAADYLTVLLSSPRRETIGQEVGALRRGLLSLFDGEPSEAWWDFDELIAGNPQNGHAHGLRALASMRMGEAEMALDSLAEVKGADPRLQGLLSCARALALEMEGKRDKSRRELLKARRGVPEVLEPSPRL